MFYMYITHSVPEMGTVIIVARGPAAAEAQLRGEMRHRGYERTSVWKPEFKTLRADQPGLYVLKETILGVGAEHGTSIEPDRPVEAGSGRVREDT